MGNGEKRKKEKNKERARANNRSEEGSQEECCWKLWLGYGWKFFRKIFVVLLGVTRGGPPKKVAAPFFFPASSILFFAFLYFSPINNLRFLQIITCTRL